MPGRRFALVLGVVASAATAAGALEPDAPIDCEFCDDWNRPAAARALGHRTWYVGTSGLSAVLIATDDGLVLIDGGLPQSAAHIAASVASLGFDLADVRILLNSHAHFDHAGGLAALQRATGATVLASAESAPVLAAGRLSDEDPQYRFGAAATAFPAVAGVRTLDESLRVELGGAVLQAHPTPGHTPGGTSWSWRDCGPDGCRDFVYADSLTAVAAPEFRFSAPAPGAGEALRTSIARVARLHCDVLITPHPGASPDTNAAGSETGRSPCQRYAESALRRLERRLADERAPPAD